MPIGYPSSPYPSVQDAMILARSHVNDTFPGATDTPGEGQILTNSSAISPFTIPFVNSAIRRVHRKLGNSGVASLIQDNYILTNLAAIFGANGSGAPDSATQVSITYAGYWNGNSLNASLKLPANCYAVLKMWERSTGSNNPFSEMVQALFGLPSRNQTTVLGDWEWRGGSTSGVPPTATTYSDGVFMCGCLQPTDVRMRMRVGLPSQVSGDGTDFSTLLIPVIDCTDAVAAYIAGFYTASRGEDDSEVLGRSKLLMDMGDDYTKELANAQIRQRQAVPYQREAYGASTWGPTGWK